MSAPPTTVFSALNDPIKKTYLEELIAAEFEKIAARTEATIGLVDKTILIGVNGWVQRPFQRIGITWYVPFTASTPTTDVDVESNGQKLDVLWIMYSLPLVLLLDSVMLEQFLEYLVEISRLAFSGRYSLDSKGFTEIEKKAFDKLRKQSPIIRNGKSIIRGVELYHTINRVLPLLAFAQLPLIGHRQLPHAIMKSKLDIYAKTRKAFADVKSKMKIHANILNFSIRVRLVPNLFRVYSKEQIRTLIVPTMTIIGQPSVILLSEHVAERLNIEEIEILLYLESTYESNRKKFLRGYLEQEIYEVVSKSYNKRSLEETYRIFGRERVERLREKVNAIISELLENKNIPIEQIAETV